MSQEERKQALRYLMFIKERDVTIKARGCVDGRPQRLYTNKEEAHPPFPLRQ